MRPRLQLPVSADRHGAVRMTAFRISGEVARRSAPGHQDAFLRSRLSVCYRFSQGTFAGTRCNGRDAPITDSPAAAPIPPDANKSCTVQAFNAGPVSSTIPAGGRWRQSMWAGRTAHLPESSRRKLPPKRSEPCRVMRSSQAAGRKPVKADIGTTLVSLGSPSLSQTFRNAFARSSTSRSLWNGVGVMRSRSVPRGTVG
jgi:hypothetical protein